MIPVLIMAIRLGRLEDSKPCGKKLSQRQLYVCASPEYIERYGEAAYAVWAD